MKRLICLLLTFCFSMNVFANVSSVQKLSQHIDEYQFALTVEWNQKDQAFYDQVTNKFFSDMRALIQEGHLTKEEVLTLLEMRVANKDVIEAIKLKMMLLNKPDSTQELSEVIKDASKEMYQRGASWNGEVLIPLGIGIVIIAVMAFKWWWDYKHKCVAWEEKHDCSSSSWNDQRCWYVKDDYGNEYQECDYYWQKEVTTTCGPMNFCTRYEEIN